MIDETNPVKPVISPRSLHSKIDINKDDDFWGNFDIKSATQVVETDPTVFFYDSWRKMKKMRLPLVKRANYYNKSVANDFPKKPEPQKLRCMLAKELYRAVTHYY